MQPARHEPNLRHDDPDLHSRGLRHARLRGPVFCAAPFRFVSFVFRFECLSRRRGPRATRHTPLPSSSNNSRMCPKLGQWSYRWELLPEPGCVYLTLHSAPPRLALPRLTGPPGSLDPDIAVVFDWISLVFYLVFLVEFSVKVIGCVSQRRAHRKPAPHQGPPRSCACSQSLHSPRDAMISLSRG